MCEAHTFSGHLIEVRRGYGFASVTAEVGDANVIGDDEYNVGFLIAHGISDIIVCLLGWRPSALAAIWMSPVWSVVWIMRRHLPRKALLHLPPKQKEFACRKCYDLTYKSCQQWYVPVMQTCSLDEANYKLRRLLKMYDCWPKDG